MKVLITGGAGYIGSHTLIELDKAGYAFVVYDNLSNSSKESIKRVEKIIKKTISFVDIGAVSNNWSVFCFLSSENNLIVNNGNKNNAQLLTIEKKLVILAVINLIFTT